MSHHPSTIPKLPKRPADECKLYEWGEACTYLRHGSIVYWYTLETVNGFETGFEESVVQTVPYMTILKLNRKTTSNTSGSFFR